MHSISSTHVGIVKIGLIVRKEKANNHGAFTDRNKLIGKKNSSQSLLNGVLIKLD